MDHDGLAHRVVEPVAVQLQVLVVEDVGLAPDADLAVLPAHVPDLAAQRRALGALLAVEAVVLRVGQLDEGGVPAVAARRAARDLGLDGGVVPHGVDPDGPVVALGLLLVGLAGVLQPHLDDGLGLAPVLVHHLAEPDVAPGEPVGVVEGGDGGDLAGLVGVPAPADAGAGPPRAAAHLVQHNTAPHDGPAPEQRQVGVVVDLADGVLHVEHAVLPAEVPHLVLVGRARDAEEAGAVHLPGVEVAAHRVRVAGELQHGLDGDLVHVVGVCVARHAGDVHQGVGDAHARVLDELHLPVYGRRDSVTEPLASHGLETEVLTRRPVYTLCNICNIAANICWLTAVGSGEVSC